MSGYYRELRDLISHCSLIPVGATMMILDALPPLSRPRAR